MPYLNRHFFPYTTSSLYSPFFSLPFYESFTLIPISTCVINLNSSSCKNHYQPLKCLIISLKNIKGTTPYQEVTSHAKHSLRRLIPLNPHLEGVFLTSVHLAALSLMIYGGRMSPYLKLLSHTHLKHRNYILYLPTIYAIIIKILEILPVHWSFNVHLNPC
jgi:hypothetical protein